MESIILFSGVGLFLIILAYGLFYLKRLRRAFDQTEIRTVTGSDAERIVKAYRTEEGYLRRRSRVWLLMIAVEAAVVLITAGSYIYAANKDRWALEAEQRRIERTEHLDALKAEAKEFLGENKEYIVTVLMVIFCFGGIIVGVQSMERRKKIAKRERQEVEHELKEALKKAEAEGRREDAERLRNQLIFLMFYPYF